VRGFNPLFIALALNTLTARAYDRVELTEIAKFEYRNENWDRFFAISAQAQAKYRQESFHSLRLLEITALVRHCQWQQAANLLRGLQAERAPLVERLGTLIREWASFSAPNLREEAPNYFLPVNFHWPIPTKQITELNSDHIRLSVDSLCAASAAPLVRGLPQASKDPWALLLASLSGSHTAARDLESMADLPSDPHFLAYFRHSQSRRGEMDTESLDAMIAKLSKNTDASADDLHDSTLQRVIRQRTDERYQSEDFLNAAKAYATLLPFTDEGPLRSYLVLKEGWAYMNVGMPSRALALWLSVPELKSGNGLLASAAQALAESRDRTPSQVEKLLAAAKEDLSQQDIIEGLAEGIAELDRATDLDVLRSQIATSSLFPAIRKAAIDRPGRSAAKACAMLDWWENAHAESENAVFSCLRWVTANPRDKARQPYLAPLIEFARDLVWTQDNRIAVLEFLNAAGAYSLGCEKGVAWSFQTPKEGRLAEVTTLACEQGPAESDAALVDYYLSHAHALKGLPPASGPFWIFNRLARKKSLADRFYDKRSAFDSSVADSLFPALLVESLVSAGSFEKAYQLSLDQRTPNQVETAQKQAAHLLLIGNTAQAGEVLRRSLSTVLERCETQTRSLWGKYFVSALQEDQSMEGLNDLATPECLEGSSDAEKQTWAALLASMKRWNSYWTLLNDSRFFLAMGKRDQDRFALLAFNGIKDGKISASPSSVAPLEWIRVTAERLRSKDTIALLSDRSPVILTLQKDLQTVRNLEASKERTAALVRKQREAESALSTWLHFLQQANRKIRSYRWTANEFLLLAQHLVATGCADAMEYAKKVLDPGVREGIESKLKSCSEEDPWK
jgi:hypothetical protein